MLARLLGQALNESDQPQQTDERYRELIERFPDRAADMRFDWAMLCERRGDRDQAEQILTELLKDHPDHPRANNALGYTWADQNRNLDRAYKMIQIAVRAEPDSAPFLDSMGWVLYKLKRYDEAVRWLERAAAAPTGQYP